jgi:hypothetical protein
MPCPPVPRGCKGYKECKEFPVIQAAPKVRKESKAMMGRSARKECLAFKARLAMMGRQEPKVLKESKAMMGRSGRKESPVIQAAPKVRLEMMERPARLEK